MLLLMLFMLILMMLLLLLLMLMFLLFLLRMVMLMLMSLFADDHYVWSSVAVRSVAHPRLVILRIAASRLLCSRFAL